MNMEKYRILNKDFYVNFVNNNCESNVDITNKLKKSSTKVLIRRLIENNENTDVQIKIGEWKFNCHLTVLQCYADYFKHSNIEQKRLIELPNEQVSPTTFTKIYEWMITDELLLQREEIVELFISAFYLGIDELVDQIWICFSDEEHINENEAYLLYYEAALADVICLKPMMLNRISKFFLIVVAFREFNFMSVDDLCCLLNSDAIGVNTEIEVFMCCLRWLTYNWCCRKKYLLNVMQTVRFGLIPPGFLIELDRDMIDNAVIKRVMRIQKVKQLVIDGLKIATTQYCYGSNNSVKPRKWLYDEKCDYHLKVNQLIEYKITYEQFLGYLQFLQKCSKDHWRAFVYIKTESQSLLNQIELRQLQLLNETAQTCIVKGSVEAEDSCQIFSAPSETFRVQSSRNNSSISENPSSSAINAIISYEEWKEVETQVNDKIDDKKNDSEKIFLDKKRTEIENDVVAIISAGSSSSESAFSILLSSSLINNKKYIKQNPSSSGHQTLNKPIVVQKEIKRNNNDYDKEGNLYLDDSSSDDEMCDNYSDEYLPMTAASVSDYPSSSEDSSLQSKSEPDLNDVSLRQIHVDSLNKVENTTSIPKNMKSHKVQNEDEKEQLVQETKILFKRQKPTSETSSARTFILTKEITNNKKDKGQELEKNIFKSNKPTLHKKPFGSLFKNKTLLILGGTDPYSHINFKQSSTLIDKVLLYNDKLKQWAQLPHTAFGTRHHHAAVVCSGLVYIVGGTKVIPSCKKAFFETSIWSFNPKSKIWSFETNLPQNRRDFAVIAIEDKDGEAGLLVIGGETFDRVPLDTVWLYRVNEKTWERKASLNIGRYGFAATVVGNEIWIAGGIALSPNAMKDIGGGDATPQTFTEFITDSIECFSLENVFDKNFKGKWTTLSYGLRRRCLYGKLCATSKNEIFLIGGFGLDSEKSLNSFDSIDSFDFESQKWFKCGNLKYARHGHDIVLIEDCIVIIGGVSSKLKCALESIEMFSIKTEKVLNLLPDLPWALSGLAAVTVRGEY